jgi:hypothetical protein
MMHAMIPTSALRVYVTARTLPSHVVAEEAIMAPLRDGVYGLLAESMEDDALVAEWNGVRFVCPRFPRLRVLEGVLAFHSAYSEIGGDLIVPERIAQRAAEELEKLRRFQPSARSHILTAPWHVPVRWFVIFDASERDIVERGGRTSIRYRTSLVQATDRVASALDTLRGVGMDDMVVEELDDLRSWLEDFPATAMVELDYGDVANLFAAADLVFDETAADLQASLEALDMDDLKAAGEHYGRAVNRWAPLMAVGHSN